MNLGANFRELRYGDVRRIHIPRTSVNKGKREGRGCYAPALGLIMDSLLCYSVVSSTQPPPVVLPVVVP